MDRRRLAGLGAASGVAGALLAVAFLEAAGIGTLAYLESYAAPFENVTPAIAKLMNVGTELGLAWLLVPFALLTRRRRELVALALWAGATMAPFLVLSGVEPRHVAVNLAPLGGLIALALEALRERWAARAPRKDRQKALAAIATVLAVMAANAVFLAIMPHKVDLDRMRALLAELDGRYGTGGYALLAANAYTDFHLIRVLWPERDVRYVAVPILALDTRRRPRAEILQSYFGGRSHEGLAELAAIGKPLVFFGFNSTLAAENLRSMLGRISPALADRVLRQVTLKQHLYTKPTEWLWSDARIRLEPAARSGPYDAFELVIRCRPCG
jgi:hypothetical protein